KIRRRPYAVVLLDEIEKAHPDIFNMLLQVMEEGRLTDSFGRNVDFRNVILIMTTNAGAHAIKNESTFGLPGAGEDESFEGMKKRVMDEIEKVFRPEFLNRLDDVIIFRHLTREDLKSVVDLELSKIRERLRDRGYALELTEDAKEFLIRKGTNLDMGARPLRRSLENFVEDPLAEELLQGSFQGMNKIVVEAVKNDDGKVKHLRFAGEFEAPAETVPPDDGGASDGGEAAVS
ncbi:MAG: ATP-dependent Clp protease ATP-binding subunit, partial [Planctomycetales bacterium]|nr:ATP-dependent Clp protease ATP-binding subunit [Planctomycetales bacterium]